MPGFCFLITSILCLQQIVISWIAFNIQKYLILAWKLSQWCAAKNGTEISRNVSRKSENCYLSEMRTIEPKIPGGKPNVRDILHGENCSTFEDISRGYRPCCKFEKENFQKFKPNFFVDWKATIVSSHNRFHQYVIKGLFLAIPRCRLLPAASWHYSSALNFPDSYCLNWLRVSKATGKLFTFFFQIKDELEQLWQFSPFPLSKCFV